MTLNKIKLGRDATQKLRTLKARTGLAPNILCRLGFCLSLAEPGRPEYPEHENEGMEFNRYTLTGPYDALFFSLLKEKLLEDGLKNDVDLNSYFLSHLNRGVYLLSVRLKALTDLSSLSQADTLIS